MGDARTGELAALMRSVRLYHGARAPRAAMDALHRRFLRDGDLAFDVGAHVGDRTLSFRRLGARVVALEPQPGPARVIRLLTRGDSGVTLLREAVGEREGRLTLRVNSANPTVTTASDDFVRAAAGAGGWEGQVWDHAIETPATTLDALIARFGRPAFIKIDIEGFEDRALAGLSAPPGALSFEFTTIAREVAFRCLERLADLGARGFNVAHGETQRLVFPAAVDAARMRDHLATLPHAANSGDVYAWFED